MLKAASDTFKLFSQWLRLEVSHLFMQKTVGNSNGRHLVLFTWSLPPNSTAGVHRPLSFIRYGSGFGWRIDAFRGEVPIKQSEHGEELLARIPDSVNIHVVPSSPLQPSFRFSPQIDGGFADAIAYANHAIHLLSTDPPDVILVSGPPFNLFIAAYFVAKKFGASLILDYRDEWTECPFTFVKAGRQDRFWERRCLAAADAVLFTTNSHLKHQLTIFPELSEKKAYLLPNGWEPDDFVGRESQIPTPKNTAIETFNLAHIGTLGDHTPPHDFLNTLAELLTQEPAWQERIKVHFIGRRSPAAAAALESFPYKRNIQIVNHVSKREANRRMQEADVLLLIAAPELERYLPGKLFDYIAAGRPILVFGFAGESSVIVESLKIGVLCPTTSATILSQQLEYLLNTNMKTEQQFFQAWLDRHRRDTLASQAFDIIESVNKKRLFLKNRKN